MFFLARVLQRQLRLSTKIDYNRYQSITINYYRLILIDNGNRFKQKEKEHCFIVTCHNDIESHFNDIRNLRITLCKVHAPDLCFEICWADERNLS